jgi:hypothetical protein
MEDGKMEKREWDLSGIEGLEGVDLNKEVDWDRKKLKLGDVISEYKSVEESYNKLLYTEIDEFDEQTFNDFDSILFDLENCLGLKFQKKIEYTGDYRKSSLILLDLTKEDHKTIIDTYKT